MTRDFTRTEESGDRKIIKHKTLKNYYNHLFDIKGGGTLKTIPFIPLEIVHRC